MMSGVFQVHRFHVSVTVHVHTAEVLWLILNGAKGRRGVDEMKGIAKLKHIIGLFKYFLEVREEV